jgi:hypothetical protein
MVFMLNLAELKVYAGISLGDEENLYYKALVACLNKQAEQYSRILTEKELHSIVVEENKDVITELPKRIESFNISYLDKQALINKYNEQKTDFPILVIRPISNKNNVLVIEITRYYFGYKKKKLTYSLEGGCTVSFQFNCATQNYDMTKVELWGV